MKTQASGQPRPRASVLNFQKTFAKSVTCIVIDFISPLHALLAFQRPRSEKPLGLSIGLYFPTFPQKHCPVLITRNCLS